MVESLSQKKWMYLSFVLMGLIASGLLAPRAFAAASPTLADIYNKVLGVDTKVAAIDTKVTGVDTKVTAIKAKTDSLPSDPADQSAVEGAMFTKLETGLIMTLPNINTMNCTSDADYLIHASSDPTGTALLEVKYEEQNGSTTSFAYEVSEPSTLTFGQEAGRWFELRTINGVGTDGVQTYVTAQSTEDSNLSCQIS